MAERSGDWFRQAESDLRHARNARDAGDFTLSVLMANLPATVATPAALIDQAKALDKHYIPTRCPNGFERGAPVDFYTRGEADRAFADAEAILEFCRRQIG